MRKINKDSPLASFTDFREKNPEPTGILILVNLTVLDIQLIWILE